MARHWRCARCGTFHGTTSRFQDEPDECRECGYAEFETLGKDDPEEQGFQLGRTLNLDAFMWMAMGIAIYNVLFAMLGGFADESMLMYSAGASFVVMLLVSYTLSSRTVTSWTFAVAVFAGVVLWGTYIVLPTLLSIVGAGSLPGPNYGESDIFLAYGVLYVIFGSIGLAMLFSSRDAIDRPEEPTDEIAG